MEVSRTLECPCSVRRVGKLQLMMRSLINRSPPQRPPLLGTPFMDPYDSREWALGCFCTLPLDALRSGSVSLTVAMHKLTETRKQISLEVLEVPREWTHPGIGSKGNTSWLPHPRSSFKCPLHPLASQVALLQHSALCQLV